MRITAIERQLRHSNLSQQEWKAIRPLVDYRNKVIKKVNRGFCVVIRITAIEIQVRHSNLDYEEWNTIRSLADDRKIIIKNRDKCSYG